MYNKKEIFHEAVTIHIPLLILNAGLSDVNDFALFIVKEINDAAFLEIDEQ